MQYAYSRDFSRTQKKIVYADRWVQLKREFRAQFRVHWNCPLSMSCVFKDRKLCSLFCNNEVTIE